MTGERPEGSEGMEGAAGPDRGGGTLCSQGLETLCFQLPSPARAGRLPGSHCHAPPHPPVAWPRLSESTDSPCFSKKTEAQRAPQSFLCYPAGCTGAGGHRALCKDPAALFPPGGEIPNTPPCFTLVDTPRHKPLSPPKRMSHSWWAHLLEGSG